MTESPRPRRWSRLVLLGWVALAATIAIGAATAFRYVKSDDFIAPPFAATCGLLGLGFLHCLFGRRKGLLAALLGFVLLFGLIPAYEEVRASTLRGTTVHGDFTGVRRTLMGRFGGRLDRDFTRDFFDVDRVGWLVTVTGHRGVVPGLELKESGRRLYLDMRHAQRVESPGAWEHAVQEALGRTLGDPFTPAPLDVESPPGFRALLEANPPPR